MADKDTAPVPSAAGPQPPPPGHTFAVRGRVLMVALLAGVLVASGFVLRGGRAPGPAAPGGLADRSGAWFCPHGGGAGFSGWIAVTNPGTAPVRVRLTTFGVKGVVDRSVFAVAGGHQVIRSVPDTRTDAATLVEYFGGWVAAGAIVRSGSDPAAMAAAQCAAGPRRTWYVPDASTARGDASYLVVMNPFSQDAAVDVVIRTDRRSETHPGPLSPYVVPAGTSVALSLNTYVLQAPDERVVSGEVQVHLGRVVAGGMTVSSAQLRSELGIPSPAPRWILPGTKYGVPSTIALLNPGTRRADIEVIAQGSSAQRLVTGLDPVSLGPGQLKAFGLGDLTDVGVIVQSTNKVPFVAVRRTAGAAGDLSTLAGDTDAAQSWLVLPGIPPAGGDQTLILQNPGKVAATIRLTYLGPKGVVQSSSSGDVVVPAGRLLTIDLAGVADRSPVSVLITADEGTIVAGSASYTVDGRGYATSIGTVVPPGFLGRNRPGGTG